MEGAAGKWVPFPLRAEWALGESPMLFSLRWEKDEPPHQLALQVKWGLAVAQGLGSMAPSEYPGFKSSSDYNSSFLPVCTLDGSW